MEYISTRGQAPVLGFEDVIIAGLASDGGLYVPREIPKFTTAEIAEMEHMSYEEICFMVIKPFTGGQIPDDDLKAMITDTYKNFRHKAVAPLKQLGHQEFLLELFHGPTMAFKDFALQFLGRLFDYILTKRNERVAILGATSGDTGSAAIDGCSVSDRVEMFILHPHQKISEVQRRQMTSILGDNIHNLAIESDFDFCQYVVKELFRHQDFMEGKRHLVAVNSINWCRIMVQIVYYFYSAVHLGAPEREVSFSVPTGNLGDIFAGYIAKQMGLPIRQLVIATNSNDILHRFMQSRQYERGDICHTISPSMDIQISSNFERLLFDLYDHDGDLLREKMELFRDGNAIKMGAERFKRATELFSSHRVSDEETCKVMQQLYQETGEILDPHSAIGVSAARTCWKDPNIAMITLATAHPAKFPEAAEKAGVPKQPLPAHLADLFEREERYDVIPQDIEAIKQYIFDRV